MARKAAPGTAKKAVRKKARPRAGGGAADGGHATLAEVRGLIRLMVDNELTELSIKEGAKQIVLRRGGQVPAPGASPAPAPAAQEAAPPAAEVPQQELLEIRSPMVGTSYSAPSPDVENYVSLGDTVEPDSVVCIVEAMKVMNEIKAECEGTIAEICVKNAQPVEYGQVLFRVTP